MKLIKIQSFIYVLSLFAIGLACNQGPDVILDENTDGMLSVSGLADLGDYRAYMGSDKAGRLIIQSHSRRGIGEDRYPGFRMHYQFKPEPDNTSSSNERLSNGKSYSVNGEAVPYPRGIQTFDRELDKKYINAIYGQTIDIAFEDGTGERTEVEMYVPKTLVVVEEAYPQKVEVGMLIEWNADEQNEKGVVVELIEQIGGTGTIKPIWQAFVVPDNGQLVITEDMLSPFENGDYVELKLTRANGTFVEDSQSYTAVALSSITLAYTARIVK